MTIHLSPQAARRFILGRQGLWPGRRWRGEAGTEAAMRAAEHLQLDPLQVMARAQDIMLHGRVAGYRPDGWMEPTYGRRRFFDWGGWLAVRPMEELPHWRAIMRREAASPDWREFAEAHGAAIREMRAVLAAEGQVTNRRFSMADRARTQSYRGRKDSALALYYLWRTGEVMTHHRERFERVYALTADVAPAELIRQSAEAEADDFVLRKLVAFMGLSRLTAAHRFLELPAEAAGVKGWKAAQVASGRLVEVGVDGWRPGLVALAEDVPVLEILADGHVPPDWRPLGADTGAEAVFLSPLEPASARGRAKEVFGFDYTWEVYTPEARRRFGYYALPILWGDRIVGRFDARLDRSANVLRLLGYWPDERAGVAKDAAFAAAFKRGMARFLAFLGAERLDPGSLRPVALRRELARLRPLAAEAE